ncbi:hypothetical protein MmTuc01_2781 [Methanosarcina mazei Tuc01]|jgi:hypothetical protein|uniref:Uncharacterized protein n=1 Tax=Methanosarcina mazei Tuc01 TaxID=1236903 RepID=M1PC14_METMZ|nr:hypothetical protein MmTuc01_2781 [Methanosarcina mazei Tuc01]
MLLRSYPETRIIDPEEKPSVIECDTPIVIMVLIKEISFPA